MYDVEYCDANLRPIYSFEDSRIMWTSVSCDVCSGTYVQKMEYEVLQINVEINCMCMACCR